VDDGLHLLGGLRENGFLGLFKDDGDEDEGGEDGKDACRHDRRVLPVAVLGVGHGGSGGRWELGAGTGGERGEPAESGGRRFATSGATTPEPSSRTRRLLRCAPGARCAPGGSPLWLWRERRWRVGRWESACVRVWRAARPPARDLLATLSGYLILLVQGAPRPSLVQISGAEASKNAGRDPRGRRRCRDDRRARYARSRDQPAAVGASVRRRGGRPSRVARSPCDLRGPKPEANYASGPGTRPRGMEVGCTAPSISTWR